MINRLLIVGVGLIGGSVALCLKKKGLVDTVIGVGRGKANLQLALKSGVIDEVYDDIRKPLGRVDVVLIATPVSQNESVLDGLGWAIEDGAIITDAGSTKCDFANTSRKLFPLKMAHIIPAHPIAGGEQSGVQAAKADLFHNKTVVITPLAENCESSINLVAELWENCGAKLAQMPPGIHDRIFSSISHLPHLLAYALMSYIGDKKNSNELFKFTGAGFKDFTRIAGSSSEMWRDICLANSQFISQDIDEFIKIMGEIRESLVSHDGDKIIEFLDRAREAREKNIVKSND